MYGTVLVVSGEILFWKKTNEKLPKIMPIYGTVSLLNSCLFLVILHKPDLKLMKISNLPLWLDCTMV